jgi:hypothetical protein
MKKAAIKWLFLVVLPLGGIVFLMRYGLWISVTPAFEGVVVDADTQQPIPYAVVTVQWYKSVPGFHQSDYAAGSAQAAVTDDMGKYRIGGKIWLAPLGLSRAECRVLHPLYIGQHDTLGGFDQVVRFIVKGAAPPVRPYNAALQKRPEELVGYDTPHVGAGLGTTLPMEGQDIRVYRDDFFYFKEARKLGLEYKKIIPHWEEYKERKGTRAIFYTLQINEN